ncbi:anti-sigma factor [Siminovitchia acidinfaciens]|uniref:Regulator of SigK n=1 Tax=Siminovitchia acidinfaciens TaxID=2321395 RepID=A0A429XX81_9BACI|nr:anti-sigma factor [Siminovitchia acidinfaciens]RST73104.1 anti-sigma factor [Siminovitchia acidinfaciens]
MRAECGKLLYFMADELSGGEKLKYMKHLKECKQCSKEFEEMTDVWNALQMDFEEKDVPETLKADVMDYVFKHESKKDPLKRSAHRTAKIKRQYTPWASGFVLVLSIMALYLCFHVLSNQNSNAEKPFPSEIVETFQLSSSGKTSSRLTGTAVVLQEGESKKLIVRMEHMPVLQGAEVYQVWLLNNGKRENAGIFRPDERGTGVLIFELDRGIQFDQIGITTEPDENSDLPRGEKIAGSA